MWRIWGGKRARVKYGIMRRMEKVVPALDLMSIIKPEHESKWVAIAPDHSHVVAFDADIRKLVKSITDPKVVFHYVLPHNVGFIPTAFAVK